MSYREEVLLDRPLGYWRLDNLLDSSGHGRTLTAGNSPSQLDAGALIGDLARGRIFNGTNQYFSIAIDFTGYSLITMEAWMIWPAYANNDIIAWAFGVAGNRWYLDPNSGVPFSGTIQVVNEASGNSNGGGYPRFSAGVWHHVVCTYAKGTGTSIATTLWVDAVQQTPSSTILGNIGSANYPSSTLFIGSYFGPTLYSSASMQDVAVYGGGVGAGGGGGVWMGLPPDRIQAHYRAGRGAGFYPHGRGIVRQRR